jgi:hypothetical protein
VDDLVYPHRVSNSKRERGRGGYMDLDVCYYYYDDDDDDGDNAYNIQARL